MGKGTKKLWIFFIAILLGGLPAEAQKKKKSGSRVPEQPKLVVGIVVDQMRYDYLYRYWDKYSNEGFKRLLREGFNFRDNHYNYVPTYTGPGHASIYTGTTPAFHGIVGNDWYNRETGRNTYCAEDKSVKTVGSSSKAGEMSPVNMIASTITDELKLATNQKSKVIGLSLKDRGSILPAGHAANAAYWYDGSNGSMISSTYYMQDLPEWVKAFNKRNLADQYLSQPWTTLRPLEQYTASTADDQPFEGTFAGEQKPVFPHNIPAYRGKTFDMLRAIPAGNTYTKEFAVEAIKAESMGKGAVTDFLAVSFSTTDYVGHQFGPNSIEVEDTYLRLDQDLADFLKFIDGHLGKENVLVFLTSDHGGAHNPTYLQQLRIPAGTTNNIVMADTLEKRLNQKFGKADWVSKFMNQQVYLNHNVIESKKVNLIEVQEEVARIMMRLPGVARVFTADNLLRSNWTAGLGMMVEKGFMYARSGDVMVVLQPGWYDNYGRAVVKGTSHGSSYGYDTHVPLLWYGWQIPAGETTVRTHITDIAPSLAAWLRIQEPNGTMGRSLVEYVRK
ncbi:alkaline phosphatase PafA [Rufibacter quisquiliarum]|uniref:Putative AlkP superfamily pyrophosphatase or phosphodiesterase n=1 Tax=Rufibacter quisquiliarum TaxID=1549639 RepID=A0A839GML3_9BACT|nr:alkaline phosphatase PafA [Rufibacter quisquiliarum]MBA9076196.1 putative AlkP superfamily pyrophosphatase or phosphodiesterase [Rufibacter quisquiliarum]